MRRGEGEFAPPFPPCTPRGLPSLLLLSLLSLFLSFFRPLSSSERFGLCRLLKTKKTKGLGPKIWLLLSCGLFQWEWEFKGHRQETSEAQENRKVRPDKLRLKCWRKKSKVCTKCWKWPSFFPFLQLLSLLRSLRLEKETFRHGSRFYRHVQKKVVKSSLPRNGWSDSAKNIYLRFWLSK